METTEAFVGLDCVDCDSRFDPADATHRCPACGGILDPQYDLDRIDLDSATLTTRRFESMWRYGELLPFPRDIAVTMDEGATPLHECPPLADELDVGRVLIKDEGRNPTGTFKDRGQSLAVTAAVEHGATDVALASAGNAGHSAAAYASLAGLDAHVFLPQRAGFTQRAMVDVHDADLTIVEGGIDEAGAALSDALVAHDDWYPTSTFVTPYRHEGKKTMGYELFEQLDSRPRTPSSTQREAGSGSSGSTRRPRSSATSASSRSAHAFTPPSPLAVRPSSRPGRLANQPMRSGRNRTRSAQGSRYPIQARVPSFSKRSRRVMAVPSRCRIPKSSTVPVESPSDRAWSWGRHRPQQPLGLANWLTGGRSRRTQQS